MSSKLLIFDFDGTIVDSKQVYYHAMNKHLSELGFGKKDVDRAIDIGLNVAETLKRFGFFSVFNWLLKRKIMRDVLKHTNEIRKCRDVDAIRRLKEKKILISNSISSFVFPILNHLKLKNDFDEIYTADDFSDKAEFIKSYLKERKINRKNVYYAGDRVSDILLAKKLRINSVIIAGKCAWDSRKELLKEKPDFVIDDIKDLSEII